ncbi:MAG: Crp/Fnr family transcriptional regulator [Bacteroidota bacterium]
MKSIQILTTMENDEKLIREKLNEYYSLFFEDDLLDEISRIGILTEIKRGKLLIDIDDEMTHIPLILDGVVKVIREDQKKDEILLYYLERGDTCAISFVNCINRSKSMFRAIVENDTEFVMVPINKIEELLVNFKSWRQFIIDSYHIRLIEMVEAIESLAFMKLDERLYKYLSDQVKIKRSQNLLIKHQEIADDLNTSRVVVSRLLKKLENDGNIKLGRNRIKIIKI